MENNIIILSDTEYIKSIEIQKNNEIENQKEKLDKIETKINELEIKSNETYGNSSDLLKQIKDSIRNVEKYRKELVDPMGKEVKKINSAFKEITFKASRIKIIIEDKMKAYNKKLQAEAQEQAEIQRKKELAELEAKQKENEMFSSFINDDDEITKKENESIETQIEMKKKEPINIKSSFKTEKTQTIIKEKWTYKIIDQFMVPVEYQSPDHKKIMEAITFGVRIIPGLEVFDEGKVISRHAI